MGQYASVEITAEFTTKSKAKEMAKDLEGKLHKFIKKQLIAEGKKGNDLKFDTNIFEVDANGPVLSIRLDSGRAQNAQWQTDMLLEMFKKVAGDDLELFDGVMNTPESITYYSKDDE
jgi:hypothetical protein